jgi:hypothetical protein
MGNGVERVREKIQSFQRRYYLNIFVRGLLLTLSILCCYFLLAALIEHNLWLSSWLRLSLFSSFFLIAAFCIYRFLKDPIRYWMLKRGLSEEQSARMIGQYLPSGKDRLLNLIQLDVSGNTSALTYASIQQKSREFDPVVFDGFIDLRENKRYLKYLVVPIFVILVILLFNRSIITSSTDRIVHFTNQYSPEAPFQFVIQDQSLVAFFNEDFTIRLKLTGEAIPENVYVVRGQDQRLKMDREGGGDFEYTIENIQEGFTFQFEGAGFYSQSYSLVVERRPELTGYSLRFDYPKYLQRKSDEVKNSGNIEIPEGTQVTWVINTSGAQKAQIKFSSQDQPNDFQLFDDQSFTFNRRFLNGEQYEITLGNQSSNNKDKIAYTIDVVKDEFPKISVGNMEDSVLFKRIILGGNVSDDYGISDLSLHFRILDEQQQELVKRNVKIPVTKNIDQQSFFYNWSIDSLDIKPGQQLEYYLQVWDNDGVNGRKSTKSASYSFNVPTEENLVAEISKSQTQTEQKIDKSLNKANNLQDQIEDAHQKLKGKTNLDWQDKKMLEDIVQQKNNLDQAIQQLKEENKLLEQKKEAFTEQNERIKEKAEQIQKLMDQLLDEETKKLFEELQKLMKENSDVSQIQKILDKLNQNTNNLEKELERTLELFKQLQYDFKLEQTLQDVKQQVEDQKQLLEKTEALEKENKNQDGDKNKSEKDKGDDKSKGDSKDNGDKSKSDEENQKSQELAKEQEKLLDDSKKTSEELKELEKLGDELNKNDELPSEEESEEIQQEQEQSKDMLQQNQPSNSKSPQQKALQKMQKMQQQMEGMQSSMEMQMDAQNLEMLRQIIHGLVKLSFDQENLLKDFNDLQQNDPRFNTIAQQQLKLKDDAKVLEDSLLELGKRDPFMGAFITKEITELNDHLDKVVESNRERRRPQASNEMQLSMTSINNLALMLDDHFDMMMQMMANAQPSMKKGKQKGQKPSLSQLQQQLNQKIQDLKNSGKSGRQLSEELAEMAAEQERIRRAIQEMQQKMEEKNGGKTPGGDLPGKMEQTEMDLVNKQLTDQMIKRQQEILTRLLETEKSMREQDMDDQRKGETAKDYEKEIPKAFEEYLRLKEKEVELLKTVPPKLYPYYKKEVSEYFKRMNNNN